MLCILFLAASIYSKVLKLESNRKNNLPVRLHIAFPVSVNFLWLECGEHDVNVSSKENYEKDVRKVSDEKNVEVFSLVRLSCPLGRRVGRAISL
jgi:hypothetical protein